MINYDNITPIIEGYKEYFPLHWKNEKYKWEAVKHFQNNWDIDAEDFGAMFKKATEKAGNLLGSAHSYPKGMILEFSNADNEAVRQMFKKLYDESVDLSERIEAFVNTSEELRIKYNDGTWNNHYQNTNAISVYLWLRYPDKYYIYKYEIYRDVANELESDYKPKKRFSVNNIIDGYAMYDEICSALQADKDIREMLDNALTENCYPDTNLKTLTIDFGFYLCRFYLDERNKGTGKLSLDDVKSDDDTEEKMLSVLPDDDIPVINTWLLNYNPSIWDWDKQDDELNYGNIKKIVNSGGTVFLSWKCASKKIKQGDRIFIIKLGSAPRGIVATGYATSGSFDSEYTEEDGTISSERLVDICITGVLDYHTEEILPQKLLKEMFPEQQWSPQGSGISIRPDAAKWLIENFGNIFTESHRTDEDGWYPLPEEYSPNLSVDDWKQLLQDKEVFDETSTDVFRKIYEFGEDCTCKELSLKYGNSSNYYNVNGFSLGKRVYQKTNCPVRIDSEGKKRWWSIPFIGKDKCGKRDGTFLWKLREELAQAIKEVWIDPNQKYTKSDFLTDVYISESEYDTITALLKRKKNIILQGAPGVGKTFCAKRLAWSVIGEKNNDLIKIVQFHQSYSYEDFIMGYRPNNEGGFDLTEGAFIPFCEKARNDTAHNYYFIIDEINRGNLSKIFGELLMLIESDKRGNENTINLVYGNKPFYIPDNLYLIGMMNTADRSLAMIDYALRRRFAFFEMKPAFESDGFRKYQESLSNKKFNDLINCIISLNQTITDDETLGEGFCIGHSYFCNLKEIDDKALSDIVEYEIIPMLKEYWFDEPAKERDWSDRLRSAVK